MPPLYHRGLEVSQEAVETRDKGVQGLYPPLHKELMWISSKDFHDLALRLRLPHPNLFFQALQTLVLAEAKAHNRGSYSFNLAGRAPYRELIDLLKKTFPSMSPLRWDHAEHSPVAGLWIGLEGFLLLSAGMSDQGDAQMASVDGCLLCPPTLEGEAPAGTHERIETLRKELLALAPPSKDRPFIYEVSRENGSLGVQSFELELPPTPEDNYPPAVWEMHQQVRRELVAGDYSAGRLFLYQGPPGTGKSRLAVDLLTLSECAFFRIDARELSELSLEKTSLRKISQYAVSQGKRPVLLVEEADINLLLPRDGSNNGNVATLLDFGDGILGHLYNISLVLLTNATNAKMDPAFRDMRVNTIVKAELLEASQAERILAREGVPVGEPLPPRVALSSIYARVVQHRKAHKLALPTSPSPIGFGGLPERLSRYAAERTAG